MNGKNLEHCLRQKLTSMENSIARIYSIKSQLRNSAEQTRKDISNAIDHQLQCIRAREQELLFNLEDIMAKKEQKLCEQQEKLNQTIGACQQSLECVLSRNNTIDAVGVRNMLLRMNAIDLHPKENSSILFEFDPSDLRRDISIFGRIIAGDEPKALESLPLDVEHYDDEADLLSSALTHKSVLRLHPISNNLLSAEKSPASREQLPQPTPFSESINFWLSQMKPPTTALDCEEEFEYIRDRITSMSGSSFEVVNASSEKLNSLPKIKPDEIFNVHFSELNSLPSEYWLKKQETDELQNQPKTANKSSQRENLHNYAANVKSPLIFPDISKLIREIKLDSAKEELPKAAVSRKRTLDGQSSGFYFEKVIRCIQLSEDEHWLLKGGSSYNSPALQSSLSAENVVEDPRCRGMLKDTKSESDFQCINKKKRFWHPLGADISTGNIPVKTQDRRPANENSEELDTWESVLGWKRILEKIHASGEDEWLSPSSRKLAAKQTSA